MAESKPKITELTPEQEELLVEYRETWRAHGLSNKPVDVPTAVEAINAMYKKCGKEPPKYVTHKSPLAGCLFHAYLKLLGEKNFEEKLDIVIARKAQETGKDVMSFSKEVKAAVQALQPAF